MRTDDELVWREPVLPEWIDYNGHLNEGYYVLVFGHATDAVMERIGLGADARARTSSSLFTVEAHVRYLDQVLEGEHLEVRSALIGFGPKKLHLWHELWADGRLRATEEVLGVHVDTVAGRATPFPADVVDRITALLTDAPEHAGRGIDV